MAMRFFYINALEQIVHCERMGQYVLVDDQIGHFKIFLGSCNQSNAFSGDEHALRHLEPQ